MFEELNQHRVAVAEQIQKACEIGFTGNELEKAHKVGDIHPNGKWVWTQLPSGKYDWRVIKKTGAGSGAAAPSTAQQTAQSGKKKGISISANHPSLASVPGVQNIKYALTTYNSKYTDLSKVELIKTPKGNWDLHYDGHRLGIISGSSISDRNAAKMGWVREGTDDLTRSKRDAEEEAKKEASSVLEKLKKEGIRTNSVAYNIVEHILDPSKNGCVSWIERDDSNKIKRPVIVRPVIVQGSGRLRSIVDKREEIKHALKISNIKFEEGNDAPRGGQTGAYIKIKN